ALHSGPATDSVLDRAPAGPRHHPSIVNLCSGRQVAASALQSFGMSAVVRWLLVLAIVAALAGSALAAQPSPLRGVPLVGQTGLRLLVAADPPFVLDVDTGSVSPIAGLQVRDRPVLSVRAVGKDAVVWLARRTRGVPRAEIYVVRRGAREATRL